MIFKQSYVSIVEAKLELVRLSGRLLYIWDEAHFIWFCKIINPNPARPPLIVVFPSFKHFIVL